MFNLPSTKKENYFEHTQDGTCDFPEWNPLTNKKKYYFTFTLFLSHLEAAQTDILSQRQMFSFRKKF
jgi:hypothetical protein